MRTWGRVNGVWTQVQTDANGLNDLVYVTALIQVLQLGLGESPFYANYGIPAQASLVQQVFPDFYVMLAQQLFSQYFASLSISRTDPDNPTYAVKIITHAGVVINETVEFPT